MNAPWRIELLGRLRATQEDRVVTRFRSQRTASLLAFLAYYRDRSHAREVLIELLWPECDWEAGRNSLRVAISSLRRQLEPPGIPSGAVLIADRTSVQLNPVASITDVNEFEQGVHSAATARSTSERMRYLLDAVDRYGGELLPGLYENWILPERQRLAELYHQSHHQLILLHEQSGDLQAAIRYAHRAVSADPLREDAQRDLIRLLAISGQADAALRQYQELSRLLEQELDASPGPEIHALIEEIRRRGTRETIHRDLISARPSAMVHSSADSLTPLPEIGSHEWGGTVTFLLYQAAETPPSGDLAAATHPLLEQPGGEALRGDGDTMARAFQHPRDALAAALAVREGLDVRPRGPGSGEAAESPTADSLTARPPPMVRMALHTGDWRSGTPARDSPAYQEARRLLLAAHPGQILVSEESAVLLRHDLNPGQRLIDLGLYHLRDGAEPDRLFDLRSPVLGERDFPPPGARPATGGSLPVQLSRFFGREEEIARLRDLLGQGVEGWGLGVGSGTAHLYTGRPTPNPQPPTPNARLVTLTGIGGSGKTRLALEVARRLQAEFRGAVWYVPLADVSDPRRIADKILDALRLPRAPGVHPLDQIVTVLSRQPSLLLLDNFEQLVEEGGPTVQALLQRAPDLAILLTSRQRLDLAGEREFPVQPLPVPGVQAFRRSGVQAFELTVDAPSPERPTPERLNALLQCESVRLFVDRAQAARPDFQLTPANAAAVVRLCERLEGIPLALELAAARARILTPAQIVDRLEQRFELLISRQRGVDARHRSLRAAMDWSYQLLAPEQQRFFARLSVFRGGWTLEAAKVVCGEGVGGWAGTHEVGDGVRDRATIPTPNAQRPTPTLDSLEQLQESSLVLAEETAVDSEDNALTQLPSVHCPLPTASHRFRLLETLREYGAERLSPEEQDELALRHASHYAALAERAETELLGPGQAAWLDRLEQEHDNIRAALSWAASARAAPPSASPASERAAIEVGLRLAGALWGFWWMRGYLTEGRERVETLLALAVDATLPSPCLTPEAGKGRASDSDPIPQDFVSLRARARAQACAGVLAQYQGDYSAARSFYEASLAAQRDLGDPWGTAFSLTGLGFLAQHRGDYEAVHAFQKEGMTLWQELGNRSGIAWSLNNLASVACRQGDFSSARSLFEESLAIRRELGDHWGESFSLAGLAEVARSEGDRGAAQLLHEESLAIRRELGDRPGVAWSLYNLGELALERGDLEAARSLYEECLALQRALGAQWGIATAVTQLAHVLLRQGQPGPSRRLFAEGLALRSALEDEAGAGECREGLERADSALEASDGES